MLNLCTISCTFKHPWIVYKAIHNISVMCDMLPILQWQERKASTCSLCKKSLCWYFLCLLGFIGMEDKDTKVYLSPFSQYNDVKSVRIVSLFPIAKYSSTLHIYINFS